MATANELILKWDADHGVVLYGEVYHVSHREVDGYEARWFNHGDKFYSLEEAMQFAQQTSVRDGIALVTSRGGILYIFRDEKLCYCEGECIRE